MSILNICRMYKKLEEMFIYMLVLYRTDILFLIENMKRTHSIQNDKHAKKNGC
jgi:hypothetical protein